VSARAGDDLGFVLSNWSDGIRPFDFNLPVGPGAPTRILHTVLDRPLFRAGETVSMKHFLRRATVEGLARPDPGETPIELALTHRGSGQRFRLPVAFDADGIAESRWPIPREAKLGTYEVAFRGEVDGNEVWEESGTFRVEQFRVPSMRAVLQPPAAPLIAAREVPVDLHVAYLAGGGAASLAVKLRSLVRPAWAARELAEHPDFSFGAEAVAEGLERSVPGSELAEDEEGAASGRPGPAQVLPLTLDAAGTARAFVAGLPAADTPQDLELELEYPDVTGQLRSVAARVRLWPAALRVGLKVPAELEPGEALPVEVLALDLEGRPAPDRAVAVEAFHRATYSYRKRLVGGFYAYESAVETRRLAGAGCSGRTDARGVLVCEVAPGTEGQLVLRARGADDAGREAIATSQSWAYGAGQGWFGGTASDRMDLLPARAEHEAGETARLQVRMPFRSATALVTVEREGVMDAFVSRLAGGEPVVKVPVREAHVPNAFVSVLAVRGRLAPAEGGAPSALIDLAKPAYRLGMAELRVGWRPRRLEVQVTPDAEVHRVREFEAVFTARNASDRPLSVRGSARVAPVGAAAPEPSLAETALELAPGTGEPLRWEVEVPVGASALEWEVAAEAEGASDRLRVRQEVRPVDPVRVYQATLGRLEPALEVRIERPAGARPGAGGVRVALTERLTGGLGGVREYMAAYPYTCLEQRVSRAVALGDREAWDALMRELPAYLDGDGLLRYFPGERLAGSDSLTAYLLALAGEAGWPLPEAERGRLLAGLTGFLEGRVLRRSALATADLTVRRVAALAALARHGPVAPAFIEGVRPEPGLWPTATLIDWLELLARAPELPQVAEQRPAALTALRARLRTEGTQLALVDRADDRLPWLMRSPELAALRLLAWASADPAWQEELPALVRGALARQRGGHWGTTPANAWGTLALSTSCRRARGRSSTPCASTTPGASRYPRPASRPSTPRRSTPSCRASPSPSGRSERASGSCGPSRMLSRPVTRRAGRDKKGPTRARAQHRAC
jgi:hypothetical protein